jgi:AcrR family transcriptional regulator
VRDVGVRGPRVGVAAPPITLSRVNASPPESQGPRAGAAGQGPAGSTRAAGRGRGRPRDPGLEQRAREAALDVFAERGLSGLTIDEVATRARIGKSSIYLRWADKESLLADALRGIQIPQGSADDAEPADGADPVDDAELAEPATTAEPADDTEPADENGPAASGRATDAAARRAAGSLRDYLMALAHRRADLYLSRQGLALLRLYADARAYPDMFGEIREQAITRFVLAERERVDDAVAAGVLPPHASPVRILDAVEGAIFMHLLVTPPELIDRVRGKLDDYIEHMVDDQLRAAGYDADADAARLAAAGS